MHRVIAFWIGLLLTCSCAVVPEQVAATNSPLFVDASEAGFGPFAVAGNIPSWGYVDVFNNTDGQRWRGDINSGTGHIGRIVTPTLSGVNWAIKSGFSGVSTYVLACSHAPPDTHGSPCQGQTPAPVSITTTGGFIGFTPAAFVVGYQPNCQYTPGMTIVHQCTGSYTPYDGSTMATAVVADGIVRPGLPYGSPLKYQPGGTTGVDVECVVDLSTYGIQGQFTRPPGYTLGNTVMAVYTCP